MRSSLLTLLIIVLSSSITEAQIPVILRATSSEQHDSTGCNFVKELSRITYEAILSGKAKLWDSRDKEIQLFAPSLLEIERSSGTSFLNQEVIFIYEFWTENGKELKSSTTGFLFSNKNSVGEDVAYGYVEYSDLQESCLRNRINTNSNGNYNSNLANYIFSKNYNYKILQFGGTVINNITDSRKIFDDFIGSRKFNTSAFSTNEVPQKMVTWSLDFGSALKNSKADQSRKIVAALTTYLKENEEFLYNNGGDKVLNSFSAGKWKITKIEFRELWKKIGNQVLFDPSGIIIYINDLPLNEILYRDMTKMDFKIDQFYWIDFIKLKDFSYNITSINAQEVQQSQAFIYQKALLTYDWNKITEYVKFY